MPEAYFPYQQVPGNFMNLVVRTASDPASMVPAIRSQVLSVDKDQPVSDIMTMEQRLAKSVASKRFVMLLLGTLLYSGVGSGCGGDLWSDGLSGNPANAGDWCSHGAGRAEA